MNYLRIFILLIGVLAINTTSAQTLAEVNIEFVDSADYSGPVIHAYEYINLVKKRKQRKIKKLIEQCIHPKEWKNSTRRKKIRKMSKIIRKRGVPIVLWESKWTMADLKSTEHVTIAKYNELLGVTFQYKDTANNSWINLEWRYTVEESQEEWMYGENFALYSFNISLGNPRIDQPKEKQSAHPLLKELKLKSVRPQHIVGKWRLDSIQKVLIDGKVIKKIEPYNFSKYFKFQIMHFNDGKEGIISTQQKSGKTEKVPFVFRLENNTLKVIETRTLYMYYIIEELDENNMVLMPYSKGLYLFNQRIFFSKELDVKYSLMEFQRDQKKLTHPKIPKTMDVHSLNRIGGKYYYFPDGDEKKAVLYSGLVTQKNSRGGNAMEESVVNGVVDGVKKVWTMSGALLGEYHFKNGKKEGLQINYFENGDTSLMVYNSDGNMNGLYCRWNEFDVLLETGNFKEGQKDGVWRYFDTKGQQIKTEEFEHQQLISQINSPPEKGSVMLMDLETENGVYFLKDRVYSGKAYEYFPESYGYRVKYTNMINGLPHGEEVEIYTNGNVCLAGVNVNGQKDGYWISYHYSGDTASVEQYQGGVMSGEWRKYGNNGQLQELRHFTKGELHGVYKKWSYEGRIAEEGTFYMGKRDGVWKEYHSSGAIFSRQEYNEGEFIGTWSKWDKNGRLKEECIYRWPSTDVVCDCKIKSAGNTWLKGQKVNHQKEGDWRVINNKGEIVKHLYYRRGQIQK